VEAPDAQSTDRLLHEDEDIAFIVRDLPDGIGLDEASAILRDHRLHTAWARLPSAVLLPPSLAAHQQALRSSGSMAVLLVKPLEVAELLAQVRRSQAR
jgi:hypothetical protein